MKPKVPSEVYKKSEIKFPGEYIELKYGEGLKTRYVNDRGYFNYDVIAKIKSDTCRKNRYTFETRSTERQTGRKSSRRKSESWSLQGSLGTCPRRARQWATPGTVSTGSKPCTTPAYSQVRQPSASSLANSPFFVKRQSQFFCCSTFRYIIQINHILPKTLKPAKNKANNLRMLSTQNDLATREIPHVAIIGGTM